MLLFWCAINVNFHAQGSSVFSLKITGCFGCMDLFCLALYFMYMHKNTCASTLALDKRKKKGMVTHPTIALTGGLNIFCG